MNFKSQKGYSLIEIGVGIIIITVYLASSTAIFNGCFNTYRAIQQRNYVINYAISNVEKMLQVDADSLAPDADLLEKVEALTDKKTTEATDKLATGEYAVCEDVVSGSLINSPDTNNMRITTKVRRIPTDGTYAYDNTVLNITVLVEYTLFPQTKDEKSIPKEEILSYELTAVKVTKK